MIDEYAKEAAASCSRQDCSLSWTGGSSTSWPQPIYNKQGERVDEPEPFIMFSELTCSTCGDKWTLRVEGDATTLQKQTQ